MSLLTALALLLPLAALASWLRAVSISGVLGGLALGMMLATATTPAPLAVFILFVVVGSLGTRLGRRRKEELGVAQGDGGRRGFLHAVANAGPSGLLVLASSLGLGLAGDRTIAAMACGGLAAMLADTSASEWGQWLGSRPRDILSWKPVPVGADGGVSAVGLVAAALAAALCGVLAAIWLGAGAILPVATAGFAGNLVDSLLGSVIEPRLGRHGGALVNALAATSGILAVAAFPPG